MGLNEFGIPRQSIIEPSKL